MARLIGKIRKIERKGKLPFPEKSRSRSGPRSMSKEHLADLILAIIQKKSEIGAAELLEAGHKKFDAREMQAAILDLRYARKIQYTRDRKKYEIRRGITQVGVAQLA